MKKLGAIAGALLVSAGVWAGTAAIAAPDSETVKVKSKVVKLDVRSSGMGDYRTVNVSGKVNAKIGNKKSKKACRKGRKVRISGLGRARTSKKGRFSIRVAAPQSGTYRVKAKKKKARVAGDQLVCKKAKKKVTIP
jgi:hypothetical protein